LPGVLQDCLRHRRGRCVQIGVGKDDLRGLTPELEYHGNDTVGGRTRDHRADLGGPDEPDVVYPGMRGQCRTGFGADPGDDVEHTGR
jgi:hypothetical protein